MPLSQFLAVVRHGESEANLNLQKSDCGLYYSNCGSDPEVPLTAQGRLQADQAGDILAHLFPRKRKLVRGHYNKFRRVRQSARRIVARLPYNLVMHSRQALQKRNYGSFWNLTHEGVRVLHPAEWARYCTDGEFLYRPPGGGENYFDVFDRVNRFFDRHIESCADNQLIVTSAIVALTVRRRLEGLSDAEVLRLYEDMAVANAAILLYARTKGGTWTRVEQAA